MTKKPESEQSHRRDYRGSRWRPGWKEGAAFQAEKKKYHTMSYNVTQCHKMSQSQYQTMSHNVIQCHTMSHNVIQYHNMSYNVIQCHTMAIYIYKYICQCTIESYREQLEVEKVIVLLLHIFGGNIFLTDGDTPLCGRQELIPEKVHSYELDPL